MPTELAVTLNINGTDVLGVPSQDAVTGDIDLGIGFEATEPYALVTTSSVSALGDLHGKKLIIDTVSYTIRNVRPKINIDLTRLVLSKD